MHRTHVERGRLLMRVQVKLLGLVGSVLIICGVSAWQIHRVYYFNPLTFKRNAVTSAPWNEYKKPMELDVVYQPASGSTSRYSTENRTEINYVLSQLKEGQHVPTYKSASWTGQIWVQFRNPVSGEDYVDAVIRDNFKVALLAQTYPVTVTSGLKEFIESKRTHAKTIN